MESKGKMNLIHTTGFGSSVEIATREGELTIFGTLLENFGDDYNVSALELPGQGELKNKSLTNRQQVFLALDKAMRGGESSNIVTLNSLTTPIILDAIITNPTLEYRLAGVLGIAASIEPQKAIKGLVGREIYTVINTPVLGMLTHGFAKRLAKNKVKNGVNLNVGEFLKLAKICEQEYRPGIQANTFLKDLPQLYLHNEDDKVIPAWEWDKESWKNPNVSLQLFKSDNNNQGSNHGLRLDSEFMLGWVKDRFKEMQMRYRTT